jgi:peptide/nickel transport system permease protein
MTIAAVSNPPVSSQERPPRPMWRIVAAQFFEHRMATAAFAVIGFFCLIALGADAIAKLTGFDPATQDILSRFGPWGSGHWFGTDEAGRDVFIRLVYGTRISLTVAFVSAISAAAIGILVGSIAGYFGGIWDSLLMRATDSLLALPTLPILIILAAVDLGKLPVLATLLHGEDSSILKMIFILVTFSWMIEARLVRGAVLSLKEREFVLAARTMGMGPFGIIFREMLPNVLSPVIVAVTLNVGQAILYEAALSFLGLGIQPPTPSWGNMLNNAREIIYTSPALAVIPGLLILVVVMAFNFLGDGLQDALDPKAIRR